MGKPQATMTRMFEWLGLPPCELTLDALPVAPHESDSHYRGKFPHTRHARLAAPASHAVPARIVQQIWERCAWYYEWLYPDLPAPGEVRGR